MFHIACKIGHKASLHELAHFLEEKNTEVKILRFLLENWKNFTLRALPLSHGMIEPLNKKIYILDSFKCAFLKCSLPDKNICHVYIWMCMYVHMYVYAMCICYTCLSIYVTYVCKCMCMYVVCVRAMV